MYGRYKQLLQRINKKNVNKNKISLIKNIRQLIYITKYIKIKIKITIIIKKYKSYTFLKWSSNYSFTKLK
jgi:hypothetical protein